MTVRELIKELKKYPLGAEVGWQDHDASENEISAIVGSVFSFNYETSFDPEYCKNIEVVITV